MTEQKIANPAAADMIVVMMNPKSRVMKLDLKKQAL